MGLHGGIPASLPVCRGIFGGKRNVSNKRREKLNTHSVPNTFSPHILRFSRDLNVDLRKFSNFTYSSQQAWPPEHNRLKKISEKNFLF